MNMNVDVYYKNKFTLRYQNKEIENDYLKSIFDTKKTQKLLILGLTFFIYILYIILDFLVLSDEALPFAVAFHISMMAFFVYFISSIYFNFFRKIAITILYFIPIYAVLGTLLIAHLYNPIYVIEIYVILFWCLVAIGYMFLESVIVASIMLISSAVITYTFDIIDINHYFVHVFLMLSAWTIGLLASYMIEQYSRDNYEYKIEILQMQDDLKELSHRDYLTGLYNRRYFNKIAQELIKKAAAENKQLSVIMIDIDRFKNINDTYGHTVGDNVIKSLASLLENNIRDDAIVSRFGGEEFAILLPSTDKEAALIIAEKIRRVTEDSALAIANHENIKFTISSGVDSINIESADNISELLSRVDKALYRAKENGRNQVVVNM